MAAVPHGIALLSADHINPNRNLNPTLHHPTTLHQLLQFFRYNFRYITCPLFIAHAVSFPHPPQSTVHVHSLLNVHCLQPVHSVSTACPQTVHSIFTVYSQPVHEMFTTCPQHVHGLSTTCPQPIHSLSTSCPRPVHNLSTACPQPVHSL